MFEPATRADGTPIYRVSEARLMSAQNRFNDDPHRAFEATKQADTFRIFVIGDSSAAGVPYGSNYAFSTWVARRLEAMLPQQRFEVVNAALPGYASRRGLMVAQEIAGYEPDLLIVYIGHNEFAERRFYAHILHMHPLLFRLREIAASTRLWRLAASALAPDDEKSQVPKLDAEQLNDSKQMFAVLNDRASGKGYATARERAYEELLYRFNLKEIIATMRGVGAKVLLVTLSQNFASWAPGASVHRDGLSEAQLEEWTRAVEEGKEQARAGDCEAALDSFVRARALDSEFADLHFRIAQCEEALGRLASARENYRLASDLDRVPHGAPTRFNEIIRSVAADEQVLLADADAALVEMAPDGLVGDNLFADWVHPNVAAHQRMGAVIVDTLRQAGVPVAGAAWNPSAYTDPAVQELYAAEPELRIRERLAMVGTCLLAHRAECALENAQAVVSAHPENPGWRGFLDHVVEQTQRWK
jgi:lysophospholipase L1-like esterase